MILTVGRLKPHFDFQAEAGPCKTESQRICCSSPGLQLQPAGALPRPKVERVVQLAYACANETVSPCAEDPTTLSSPGLQATNVPWPSPRDVVLQRSTRACVLGLDRRSMEAPGRAGRRAGKEEPRARHRRVGRLGWSRARRRRGVVCKASVRGVGRRDDKDADPSSGQSRPAQARQAGARQPRLRAGTSILLCFFSQHILYFLFILRPINKRMRSFFFGRQKICQIFIRRKKKYKKKTNITVLCGLRQLKTIKNGRTT